MKRKISILLLLVIMASFAVFSLSACGHDDVNLLQAGSDNGDIGVLQMNKKYINSNIVNKEEDWENYYTYYIFYSNGTGQFRYFYVYKSDFDSSYDYVSDYTITFKYTYTDKDRTAVMCFYDSVEYGAESRTVSTNWKQLITVSKNVLCVLSTSGYAYYINEDYTDNIPNYNS